MSSTVWPNRIFEGQTSENRYTCLKFSSKRENSALSIKIVQNPLFRSWAARFGQFAFVSVKVLKIVTLASNSLQNGKTVRFPWILYITLFSGHAEDVLAKSHFWASKLSKSSHWPQILSKTGKQCAFNENCTKRFFQVMRSTFWPNRICERQSVKNRHTGLKISPKRQKSALIMKIVQNPLFLGHEQHVLAKSHFWASKLSKSSHWPEILFRTGKQCAFHENCTKPSFQVMRRTFSPNRICERQSVKNRHTGLKISPKRQKKCAYYENCTKPSFQVMSSTVWQNRIFEGQSSENRYTCLKFSSKREKRENSALSNKIVQNVLYRSCAARFGQIAFLSVKVLKMVTLAWNSRQKWKTVRFSIKIVQNARFRSCAARFGQIAFVRVKVVKIVTLASNSLQNEKTVRFP